MKRREFMALLAMSMAMRPTSAGARAPVVPVIGLLNAVSFDGSFDTYVGEIRFGLKETGFTEGQNLRIEYRSAEGHPERLPELAADLVRSNVALVLAIGGANSARAAKANTSVIPIVFAMGGDAVEAGLVKSLNKPEGNITGISFTTSQLAPKRLELLSELVPQAHLVGYLDNTVNPSSELVRGDLAAKAQSIGREIVFFYAGTEQEIESAFDAMVERRIEALVVSVDAFLTTRRDQIVSLTEHYAIPAISTWREAALRPGGLMSYAPLGGEVFRQAGVYAGRILNGARPADLPVQLPTRFELVVNLKTAKALGLTVPPSLLAIADEVVE